MKLPRELVIARRSVFALFAFLLLSLVFNTHLPALGELKPVPFRFLIELVCVVLFFSIFIVHIKPTSNTGRTKKEKTNPNNTVQILILMSIKYTRNEMQPKEHIDEATNMQRNALIRR